MAVRLGVVRRELDGVAVVGKCFFVLPRIRISVAAAVERVWIDLYYLSPVGDRRPVITRCLMRLRT